MHGAIKDEVQRSMAQERLQAEMNRRNEAAHRSVSKDEVKRQAAIDRIQQQQEYVALQNQIGQQDDFVCFDRREQQAFEREHARIRTKSQQVCFFPVYMFALLVTVTPC